jgi:tol-pal system protein YbgF
MTGWFDKAALAALGTAALLVAMAGAQAQEMSLGALVDRLDRIERDLGSVQRQLAREGAPAAAGTAAIAPETAARQEIRLGEIEEQVRLLTGQVEEARFHVRQLGEDVVALAADIEGRLAAVEQRLGVVPPAVATAEPDAFAAAAPGEGASAIIDSGGAVVVGGDANAELYETMGVLGTVPVESGAAQPAAAGEAETAFAAIAPVAPQAAPAPVDPESQYQSAIRLLSQTDYAAAEAAFQAIIDDHPDHPLAGNAHFWVGEIHMKRQDYKRAARAFARGYKAFPNGNKAADNLLKLGMAFAAMDKTEEACATFVKLERDHADAPAHVRDRLPGEWVRAGCG